MSDLKPPRWAAHIADRAFGTRTGTVALAALGAVALFAGMGLLSMGATGGTVRAPGSAHFAPSATSQPAVLPYQPNWNSGNLCTVTVVGNDWSCHSSGSKQCSPPLTYNFSASNTNISIHISGSSNCVFLNFRGNYDNWNIRVTGSKFPTFVVQTVGEHNHINLDYQGSRINSTYVVYLEYNTYNLSMAGSDNHINTYFVGAALLKGVCPFKNMAAKNDVNLYSVGSYNLQNVTYVNAIGLNTSYVQTGMDGSGMANVAGWQNVSESWACPWTAPPPSAPGAGASIGSVSVGRVGE